MMYYFTRVSSRAKIQPILNSVWLHVSVPSAKENHVLKIKSKTVIEKQKFIIDSLTCENQNGIISDIVTPYWKLSYKEELNIKQKISDDAVGDVFHLISRRDLKKDSPIINEDIIPSPVRDSYRHKDEFSVWPGLDGNPKTVGFFVGSPALGKVICIPATALKCIKESHKQIAELYQDYIRSSPLPVSYQLFDKGFWRNIIVKSNSAGDHMATVITLPGHLTDEQLNEQQQLLKEYFSRHVPSLSLYHQSCRHLRCTREQASLNHLSGEPFLTERLGNITLRLSPDSFFQQNRLATELMYQEIIKLIRPKHFTTLLDLYCGVGGLSLLAHNRVRGCVGIDESQSAVDDATHNASSNNATNCSFICGKVESVLPRVLKKLDLATDIVAVVNPGRGGAAESVISLLRNNRLITKIVYISCKPDNPLTRRNFIQLCERMSHNSRPFSLTAAVPIDLFPYTNHYKLIFCFKKQ